MELIYLWVEKYKNIEKQGFNFSPKFECSYDEGSKELTIDEKEHLKNFFGENINVIPFPIKIQRIGTKIATLYTWH